MPKLYSPHPDVTLTFNGSEVTLQAEAAAFLGVCDAAEFLAQKAREKVGVQGPPPSSPGQPPHMDSQAFRDSIGVVSDREQGWAAFGSPLDYGDMLEHGTSQMEARPWLGPTVQENEAAARAIVAERTAEEFAAGEKSRPAGQRGGRRGGRAGAGLWRAPWRT